MSFRRLSGSGSAVNAANSSAVGNRPIRSSEARRRNAPSVTNAARPLPSLIRAASRKRSTGFSLPLAASGSVGRRGRSGGSYDGF